MLPDIVVVAPETNTTTRLLLRRPKPSDASAVYEYTRDPEVTRFMDWPAPSHIGDTIAAGENMETAVQYEDTAAQQAPEPP